MNEEMIPLPQEPAESGDPEIETSLQEDLPASPEHPVKDAEHEDSISFVDPPGNEDSEDRSSFLASDEERDLAFIIEALVFASDEPISFKQLRDIIIQPDEKSSDEPDESREEEESPKTTRRGRKALAFTVNFVRRAVAWLNGSYEESGRSFRIVEVAHGFAFQTISEFGVYVGRLYAERSRRKLTQAALETLAIIAFKQPISKPAVEAIRGVNADFVVKSLLERDLITIVGREDSVGRPLLYGTTTTFLKHFGLRNLTDLPKPREMKEMLREDEGAISHSIEELLDDNETGDIVEEFSSLFDTLHHPQTAFSAHDNAQELGMTGPATELDQEEQHHVSDDADLPTGDANPPQSQL